MIKLVYCVKRHPKVSPEKFTKYWLENHGSLVKKNASALKMKKYVQSHAFDTPVTQIAHQMRNMSLVYDGLTECWWDSIEDLAAALQTPEGQEASKVLAVDEANFVDLEKSSIYFTHEHPIFG